MPMFERSDRTAGGTAAGAHRLGVGRGRGGGPLGQHRLLGDAVGQGVQQRQHRAAPRAGDEVRELQHEWGGYGVLRLLSRLWAKGSHGKTRMGPPGPNDDEMPRTQLPPHSAHVNASNTRLSMDPCIGRPGGGS